MDFLRNHFLIVQVILPDSSSLSRCFLHPIPQTCLFPRCRRFAEKSLSLSLLPEDTYCVLRYRCRRSCECFLLRCRRFVCVLLPLSSRSFHTSRRCLTNLLMMDIMRP